MFLRLFLFFVTTLPLFAENTLLQEYEVSAREVKLSHIIPNVEDDMQLYTITPGRYIKKVKTSELLELLNSYGYDDFKSKHRYIKFSLKSPIELFKIEEEIKEHYLQMYKKIEIRSIKVKPRAYISSLPDTYTFKIPSRTHLNREGVFSIKSEQNRQLFFNYFIDASVDIYQARKDIKRNSELSNLNCVKKSIILDKFKATPVQEVRKGRLQSKRHIKNGTILTSRDVEELYLIKRGSMVNITLNSSNLAISFSAKALEDGVYGDVIKVQKNNLKTMKIKVTGKNKGETL